MEIPGINDERVRIAIGPIETADGEKMTLRLRRIDFLPDEVQDAIQKELLAGDVEAQIIGVAKELVETPVNTPIIWAPVLKQARAELQGLGVKWERVAPLGYNQDKFTAPTKKIVDALAPWADKDILPLPRRQKQAGLIMLKHVCSEEEYTKCERLTNGQVKAIVEEWQSRSEMKLGEFLASESS